MDRELLKKLLPNALENPISEEELKNKELIGLDWVEKELPNKNWDSLYGAHYLAICLEEMAELQKEITKALKDQVDYTGLMEEMADVYIVLSALKHIFNIKDEDINAVRQIKFEQLIQKIKRYREEHPYEKNA